MKGFSIVEQGHVVQLIDPQSASAALTSDTFCLENWAHASIIVNGGAGSGLTVTLYEATSAANSGATLIGFKYAQEATVDGDTLDAALATATTAGVAMGTSNVFLVIELDADELTDGYPWVTLNTSDPGASRLISAVAVLSGGRYQEDITATAIA
jgi:hypothetical protein